MRIDLKGIDKVYKDKNYATKAIKNLDLVIENHQRVVIVGPSGAGKSTLLNIIGLIDSHFKGDYEINGINCQKLSQKHVSQIRNESFGFIFQDYLLVESDTVYNNVKIPLLYSKVAKYDYRARIMEALQLVEMDDLVDKRVKALSGGQRQRVAIARSLVHQPKFILADEPTGSLDSRLTKEVMLIIDRYCSNGHGLIMVTHDERLLTNKYFTRILTIDSGRLIDDQLLSSEAETIL